MSEYVIAPAGVEEAERIRRLAHGITQKTLEVMRADPELADMAAAECLTALAHVYAAYAKKVVALDAAQAIVEAMWPRVTGPDGQVPS